MATNAKNIAELLNTDTTVAVGDIADGSVTTAKLAADSVTTAKILDGAVTQVKAPLVSGSGQNLVINGGMQVDQRNVTMQFSASSNYKCDRWYCGVNAGGTFAFTQDSDSPDGFAASLKIACTTADTTLDAGSYGYIMHKLEGNALQSMNSSNGIVEHTISFYTKSSKTGTYTLNLRDEDNAQGNSKTFTISTADTWERHTLTFPAHSSGTLDNDNNSSYRLFWFFAAGTDLTSGTFYDGTWGAFTSANRVSSSNVNLGDNTSNNFFITGIKMETGGTATDFNHEAYGDVQQKCRRYYMKYEGDLGICGTGHQTDADDCDVPTYPPVEMRARPTVTKSSVNIIHSGGTTTDTTINNIYKVGNCIGLNFDSATTPFGTDQAASMRIASGGYLAYDSEL